MPDLQRQSLETFQRQGGEMVDYKKWDHIEVSYLMSVVALVYLSAKIVVTLIG